MHRIDTPTAQKDKFGVGKNGFTAGNPQTGTPATDLDNDYFDMLQEELAGVVEATGVNLDKSKHNQLLTALKALFLSRAHPFADIRADGAATIAEALSNLGLGEGSMLPVGTPIPWPLATPPTGFLKMNGATFDKVANPKLALAYPSGVLPDLRAQTIRGWDDGRGIDTGRALLSEQGDAIRNIIGSAANVYTGNPDLATGVITYTGTGITSWQSGTGLSISYRNLNINAATQVPTAAENRVKSVAFNYIVRAQ
ncbi:tail fiber protein [Citrobacter braakii]|uniref:tail fiber protein n=1 Tax=Citrobacter braakii TaxID=57706 RepID=UPI002416F126|nr:tail fiber protein [Citrobacter braakii]WFO45156.1 tail fiber protein [Citrobacter braakii]